MKKVVIKEINKYNYTLVDSDNIIYIKNIEFYSKYKPNIGDILYLDDDIINDVNLFTFDDLYDKDIVKKEDIVKVINKKQGKEYYLQRRFG